MALSLVKEGDTTIKKFPLSDEQVVQIRKFNSKLVAVRNLVTDPSVASNPLVYNKLIDTLAEAQEQYDGWFNSMEKEFGVTTTPANRWNVDFAAKTLELL